MTSVPRGREIGKGRGVKVGEIRAARTRTCRHEQKCTHLLLETCVPCGHHLLRGVGLLDLYGNKMRSSIPVIRAIYRATVSCGVWVPSHATLCYATCSTDRPSLLAPRLSSKKIIVSQMQSVSPLLNSEHHRSVMDRHAVTLPLEEEASGEVDVAASRLQSTYRSITWETQLHQPLDRLI